MTTKTIVAEKTFINGKLLPDIAVSYDTESGSILEVTEHKGNHTLTPGWLIPGFINMHCHLELSHLKGKIPKGSGMAGFILQLLKLRRINDAQVKEAIKMEARTMHQNGIRAVADISNDDSTFFLKHYPVQSTPEFFTFCETFGLDPTQVEHKIHAVQALKYKLPKGRASITWHAPYSMSPELISEISRIYENHNLPMTLHFMESKEELQLFSHADGPIAEFLKNIGANPLPDHFGNTHVADFILPLLPRAAHILFVHVTELDKTTFQRIQNDFPNRGWCLCPGANQYIHGTLPPADMLLKDTNHVMLGTDSLAGNTELNILSEIKILSTHFPEIPTETLIQWATANAARFLNLPYLGNIAPGNKPGLVMLTNTQNHRITHTTLMETII